MSPESRPDLAQVLRQSLDRIEAGEPAETVLAAFPEHADALRPLLEAALALGRLPLGAAPEGLTDRIGAAIVAEASEASEAGSRAADRRGDGAAPAPGRLARLGRWLRAGLPSRALAFNLAALLLAIGLLLASAAAASADSLPGGPLYPIKRGIEQARLLVAGDARAAELASSFAQRRLDEARALRQAGRSPDPALEGLKALAPWSAALPAAAQTAIAEPRAGDRAGASEASSLALDARQSAASSLPATRVPRRGPTAVLRIEPEPSSPAPADAEASRAPAQFALAATAAPSPRAPTASAAPLPSATRLPQPSQTPTPQPPAADDDDDENPPRPTSTERPTPPPPSPTDLPPIPMASETPAPSWNVVTGTVSNQRGDMLADARVSFVDMVSGERVDAATTDAAGSYVIRLVRGRYLVVASAEGYKNQWFRGQAARETANPVPLPGDGTRVQVSFRLELERPLSQAATPPPSRPGPEPSPTADPSSRPRRTPTP